MSAFVMRDLVTTCTNPTPHGDADDTTDIPTRLHYTPTDPYAIHLTLYPPTGQPVEWLLARQLLIEGFAANRLHHAGQGDARVWIWAGRYWIHLTTDSGEPPLLICMAATEMRAFLTATLAAVKVTTEPDHLDIDGLIGQLLEARHG